MRFANSDSFSVEPGRTVERRHAALLSLVIPGPTPAFSAFVSWQSDQLLGAADIFQAGPVPLGLVPLLSIAKFDVASGIAGIVTLGDQRSGLRAGPRTIAGRTTAPPPAAPFVGGGAGNY